MTVAVTMVLAARSVYITTLGFEEVGEGGEGGEGGAVGSGLSEGVGGVPMMVDIGTGESRGVGVEESGCPKIGASADESGDGDWGCWGRDVERDVSARRRGMREMKGCILAGRMECRCCEGTSWSGNHTMRTERFNFEAVCLGTLRRWRARIIEIGLLRTTFLTYLELLYASYASCL